MITAAAVKIYDKRQQKEIIIPCHRHCDAFYILKSFGYNYTDFDEIDQGFLDENDKFYNRIAAYKHAWQHMQLKDQEYNVQQLFSEDLW